MSPTQRSLARLRADGWTAEVVEKWIPTSPAGYKGQIIRRDLFNFADIVAVKVGNIGVLFVQTTTGSNAAKRMTKIKQEERAGIVLASGNKIAVHSWAKRGERGKAKRWSCVETYV